MTTSASGPLPDTIDHPKKIVRAKAVDWWISLVIFVVSLTIFLVSPVRSLGETQYTMMLAYTLIQQRTFALDPHVIRLPDKVEMIDTTKVRRLPLEIVDGRVYKYAPPGSAVLSIPLVLAASGFKLTPLAADGTYDARRELTLSGIVAAILMAAFAAIGFQFSRLLLPVTWSLIITAVATFGTQVWSTAARVVEPDTWTILLLSGALFLLVAHEVAGRALRPVLLASLLAAAYFVHPTSSISIAGISAYVILYHRKRFLPFALTGVAWLLGLVTYSWQNFGQILPNYYQASRLGFQTFWEALAGNLISPSRGLLIYVPVLLFVGVAFFLHWRFVPVRALVVTGMIVVVTHLLVISGFSHWWAGHAYGPRYWTSIVPWFVLFGCTSVAAVNKAVEQKRRVYRRSELLFAGLLALVSIFIQARGALAEETKRWNARPYDIDLRSGRLWNYSYPQFLAGLIHPPLPGGVFPLLNNNERVDLTAADADRFLWYGWSDPEPHLRWTDSKEAAIVFTLADRADRVMIIEAAPFIVSGVYEQQQLMVKLNGTRIESMTLNRNSGAECTFHLPAHLLRRENVITLQLPDAESPANLGVSEDNRYLGIAAEWMEIRSATEQK